MAGLKQWGDGEWTSELDKEADWWVRIVESDILNMFKLWSSFANIQFWKIRMLFLDHEAGTFWSRRVNTTHHFHTIGRFFTSIWFTRRNDTIWPGDLFFPTRTTSGWSVLRMYIRKVWVECTQGEARKPTTERYSSIHYCHLSLIVFISWFQYTRRSSHRPISQGSPAKPFTGSDAKTHATLAAGWSPLTWWV